MATSPPSSKPSLCGVALLRLRGAFCGCDDLTIFEQPELFNSLVRLTVFSLQLDLPEIRSMPVRGPSMNREIINDVTGVILAGGKSTRMGSNKALLPYRGGRFIEAIHRLFADIFSEVILVTNTPDQYDFLPCRKEQDILKGMGVLAGIHSGLYHSSSPAIFAVACDMPYLVEGLIRHMASRADAGGVLIPEGPDGLEPLHAVYGKGCLAAMETTLLSGQRRIVSFFDRTNVSKMNLEQVAIFDPSFVSFMNINTPVDYYELRDNERLNRLDVERDFSRRLHSNTG